MSMQEIIALMEKEDVAARQDLVGVPNTEIESYEGYFGISFPTAYRDYLHSFGRSAGFLSTWMAIYFDDLKEIQDDFDMQIDGGNYHYDLPENALLISNWGTIFDFIICGSEDNPAVYRLNLFDDDTPMCIKYTDSFTHYLEKLVMSAKDHACPSEFHVDHSGNIIDGNINDSDFLTEERLQKL